MTYGTWVGPVHYGWDGGRLPGDPIGPGPTRTLLALLACERPTISEIARRSGRTSTATIHQHLRLLRSEGLVDWEPGSAGTLRPLVYEVPL